MITDRPAGGFDTKVAVASTIFSGHSDPAWARFTDGSDQVEVIYIRKDGDFSALIHTVPVSRIS